MTATIPHLMTNAAAERLRNLVRAELRHSGWNQAEIAAELGLSQKHISQVLTGRAGLSVDLAAAILFVCGRRLEFATTPHPLPGGEVIA